MLSPTVAYARTKAEGEAAVQAAFPPATILRPSVLFGEDDQFINMFAGLIAQLPRAAGVRARGEAPAAVG